MMQAALFLGTRGTPYPAHMCDDTGCINYSDQRQGVSIVLALFLNVPIQSTL
jgi:hypothetical protein